MPAEVSKPQSVPAWMRRGSPIACAARSSRSATTSGCSTIVGGGVDDADDERLVGRQRHVAEDLDLVGVARVGERQHEGADVGPQDGGCDLAQGHVAVVRRLVVAPAHVQPHALARDAGKRAVDLADHAVDEGDELLDRAFGVGEVALQREVGGVDLKNEPRIDAALYSTRRASASAAR